MTYTAAPYSPRTQFEQFREYVRGEWEARSLDDCLARRAELGARVDVLERDDACGETVILDELISEKTLAKRAADIDRIRLAAQDPANLEGPAGAVGAPALVKGLGDRRETGAEVIQRMRSNPWRAPDGGSLAGHTTYGGLGRETASGYVSRAHTALEGLEATLTRDGCQRLAEAMAEQSTWPGVMIRRSKEEQAQAAELWLALSNPFYAEAFRNALRYKKKTATGDPCEACGGVECGTPRVLVCCEGCTH